MTYESSRQSLKNLGRDARFEDDIGHYNFRCWSANEVNRKLPVRLIDENNYHHENRRLVPPILTSCL
ncbi:hypothetical protein BDV59DRAFT_168001 [Aspergillus ambiguus]|uniref:uncharacterized protein n=1 Tax=Aspergillus ambiguus TaxID=176160 RepID=UPI003CCE4D63